MATLSRPRQLAQIMHNFHNVVARLRRCRQWGGYLEVSREQTALDHALFLTWLADYMLGREQALGSTEMDDRLILRHAMVSNFARGALGDVLEPFLADPRISPFWGKIVQKETERQLGEFGPLVAEHFSPAVALSPDSREAEFFRYLEALAWILFALEEHVVHGKDCFIEVYHNHHPTLVEATTRFRSFAELYSVELQGWVNQQLSMRAPAVRREEVAKPTLEHLHELAVATAAVRRQLLAQGVPSEQVEQTLRYAQA